MKVRNRTPEQQAEARAKTAATHARKMEARALSVIRFGNYAVGYLDEWNYAYWDTKKNVGNPEYYYYPSFEQALCSVGRRLASDHAVQAGADLRKWLAGCERIAQAIEKIRRAP